MKGSWISEKKILAKFVAPLKFIDVIGRLFTLEISDLNYLSISQDFLYLSMRRGFTALLLLTLLVFLCLQTKVLPFFEGTSLRRNILMNAHTTSSGAIDIKADAYNTFYVEADLSYSYSHSSQNSSASNTGRMMVSISNDETMVAEKCLNFSSYDCNAPNCNKLAETGSIDFPSFVANVQYAHSNIYLEDNYWRLNSAAYLYLAQSCTAGPMSPSSLGSGQSGVLGLGIGNGSRANFPHDAVFSIFLSSDLTKGKLLFKKDTSSYPRSSSSLYAFPTNSTWQIYPAKGSIQIEDWDTGAAFDGNMMFDLNFDAIGLPPGPFSVFMDFVFSSAASCNSSGPGKPSCFTRQKLEDLPGMIFSINNQDIKVPSQVYATAINETKDGRYFYLNVKQVSPSLSGENYVSPSFANSLVLGANFLSYYYTVFDASGINPAVYLYPSINVPWEFNPFLWIPVGLAVIFICCCCCCCCCCPKEKKSFNHNETPRKDLMIDAFKTAPLVENEQRVNYMESSNEPENATSPYQYDGGENNFYQPRPIYQPYQPPQ